MASVKERPAQQTKAREEHEHDCFCTTTPPDHQGLGASPPPVKKVRGQLVSQPPQEGFPRMYPVELLTSFQPGINLGMTPEEYPAWWLTEARRKSEERGCTDELKELLATGRSNQRPTEWALMDIQPFSAFSIHAHGTIEIIHIVKGALYERRVRGPALYKETNPHETKGPDLSKSSDVVFDEGVFREGGIYVNEVGSIHQSFTKEEGCLLLCIWGGSHLTLPPEHWPTNYDPKIS